MITKLTNVERFDVLLAEHTRGRNAAAIDLELRHMAEHLGLGDMRKVSVSIEEVRECFARMPPAMQAAAIADIEICPF